MIRRTHPEQGPGPAGRLRAVVGDARPPGLPRRARADSPTTRHQPTGYPGWQEPDWGEPAWQEPEEPWRNEVNAEPTCDEAADAEQPDPNSSQRQLLRPGRATGRAEPAAADSEPATGLTSMQSQPAAQFRTTVLRLGRAHAATVAVLIVVALVFTGTRLMAAQGHDVSETPTPTITPAPSSAEPAASASPQRQLQVHVTGAVANPGVVTVPDGARVADAIAAAGGLAEHADCGELNLAATVPDGAQILIGTITEPRGEVRTEQSTSAAAGSTNAGGSTTSAGTVNLNTATAQQLEALPGVGPVTAQRILAWRQANGNFTRVEELQEVDGIGPKSYAQLAPLVHV